MQNLKPTHFSVVADHPSAVSHVLDRVAGIAPSPLLPGEQEAEYATHVARIVAAAQPRDAIEDLLTRDVIDLSWEILRLRRIKAGILKASMSDGVREVLDGLVDKIKRKSPRHREYFQRLVPKSTVSSV